MRVVWWHYNRPATLKAGRVQLTVHHAGTCHVVDKVMCLIPCQSVVRKRQPRCIMKAKCKAMIIYKGIAIIN
jgi:hypothetical protein